jgi:hypothetical protein
VSTISLLVAAAFHHLLPFSHSLVKPEHAVSLNQQDKSLHDKTRQVYIISSGDGQQSGFGTVLCCGQSPD